MFSEDEFEVFGIQGRDADLFDRDLFTGIEPMDWDPSCTEEPMDWESVDCQEPMDWEEVPLPPQVSLPGTSFSTPPVVRPAAANVRTPSTSARRVKKAMRSA
ncbi:hypothetical protein HNY73_017671 [Argiope bruennichi]|uniref:Uncharacterized protein n=1 Tax=Argiope bruennichi TaxID=94029 RepID=A0A8T0EBE0_ARGBR|nr:hypothetical protein HNY73_017671 [Argiope bruennichi]